MHQTPYRSPAYSLRIHYKHFFFQKRRTRRIVVDEEEENCWSEKKYCPDIFYKLRKACLLKEGHLLNVQRNARAIFSDFFSRENSRPPANSHILTYTYYRASRKGRKNAPVSPYKMPPFLYSAGQKVFLSRLVTTRGGAALQMMMDLSRTFSTNAKKKFKRNTHISQIEKKNIGYFLASLSLPLIFSVPSGLGRIIDHPNRLLLHLGIQIRPQKYLQIVGLFLAHKRVFREVTTASFLRKKIAFRCGIAMM